MTNTPHQTLRFTRLHPKAERPRFKTKGAAGMDITSVANITLEPGGSEMIPTGLAIALPTNHEAQIRPRSGLAAKHQVTVLNAPGTIDEDYRGEIKVILINHGSAPYEISVGDRIAQMVIQKVAKLECIEVDQLDDTVRGSSGFGSTGQ